MPQGLGSQSFSQITTTIAANSAINVNQWGGINTTLGQKTMSASVPVVIASDQSAVPVSGTFWQATQPVSIASSVTVTQATGTNLHTVIDSGTVTTVSTVSNLSQIASVTPTFGDVNNSTTETGSLNVAPVGRYNATLPTITDTRYNQLQIGSKGSLQVNLLNVNGTGELFLTSAALADTASATPATTTVGAVPLLMNASSLDRARAVVNATDSVGTGIAAAGIVGQFDDVSPGTVTENRFGNIRMSVRREVYSQIRDAAGNERGLNVDANGAIAVTATNATASNLKVAATLDAETTKVIGTVRNLGNVGAIFDGVNTAATAPANGILGLGIYNSTEPSPTTGQSVGLQQDSKGRLRQVIMDAAGNTRGANVDASSRLSVTIDNIAAAQTLATVTTVSTVTNLSQMNGAAISMGVGATGTGVQRVVLPNDAGRTLVSKAGQASSSGNNTLVSAGSTRLKVYAFSLSTVSTTAVTCIFQDGAGGTALWRVVLQTPAGVAGGANLVVQPPAWLFATSSATLLNLNLSAAVAVDWSLSYYDEA